MAVDIREGDILTVSGTDYPIRAVAEWTRTGASSPSFSGLATVTASTKRASISSGKRGTPTQNLASVSILPLMPVDPEIRQRLALDTPHELAQTFAADSTGFVHLIVEVLKR